VSEKIITTTSRYEKPYPRNAFLGEGVLSILASIFNSMHLYLLTFWAMYS
jgi:hypothetical protein